LAVVPAPRENVFDDLRGVVRGELLSDELSRAIYATDASLFEVEPLGVVVPCDEEDLQALVRYAGEHEVPLVARGAGTGLAGEALGAGLIVDLSVHFRRILDVSRDTVRLQPGVTLRQLEAILAKEGRRFVPTPASIEATVGGVLATNASGPRALRYGTTRDHVESFRVVLDTGDAVSVAARAPRWPDADHPQGRLDDIVSSTATLLEQNASLLQTCRPRVPFDRCGYAVHDALGPRSLDMARLLCGSEGTLALITEATLHTQPLPGGRAIALLAFARIESGLRAARLALSTAPSACMLLDRRLLRLARGDNNSADLVPEGAESALVVEYEADSPRAAQALGQSLIDWLVRGERLALWSRLTANEADCVRFWGLAQAGLRGLYPLRGAAQPVPIVEDVAVPPEELSAYLPRVQDVLRRQETTAAFLIHAGTGQVQMLPFLDLQNPRDSDRLWALADELYPLVLEMGGTISSMHGTGIARMPWAVRQYGPLAPVMRELKAIFDPRFLFNPGKVVPPPTQALGWPLRKHGKPPLREVPTQLAWAPGTVQAEALGCNGCGDCRTTAPNQRMCPIFRATQAEAATPRAKANLMRALLQPDADPALFSSDEVREVADLCVNCKMCAYECPARVQIPQLMLEAKAANVAKHGLTIGDRVLSRAEGWAGLGSAFAPVVNAFLANPIARWLLERFFGVSSRRRLPMFASTSFLRLARQRGWTRKPHSARPRVAYFSDIYANYNDPLIAEATVAVLHHNGIEVYVPPDQLGSGMAPLACGDTEVARDTVRQNLLVLAELAREGFPILCSEPSAAIMLRQDALSLIDDSDARLVAGQTVELTAFLWDLHQQGQLRTDFAPIEAGVGHHVPCHLKALGRPPTGPGLLSLIPGLRVQTIDVSCSGMAGTYGFRADCYETSLAAGKPMLEELSRPAYLFGSTECSACRLQMEDGTLKRTLHPVQYLALAYGLLPAVAQRLREPIGEWILK
jgi:FAD/FMN-containing dehydrogenase/Fe-S oxidoreductase